MKKIKIISIKNGLITYLTYEDSRINITTLADFTQRYDKELVEVFLGKSEGEGVKEHIQQIQRAESL